MTPEFIRASADGMIRNFGPDAADLADALAQKFIMAGDKPGANTWQNIAAAVRGLPGDMPGLERDPPGCPHHHPEGQIGT